MMRSKRSLDSHECNLTKRLEDSLRNVVAAVARSAYAICALLAMSALVPQVALGQRVVTAPRAVSTAVRPAEVIPAKVEIRLRPRRPEVARIQCVRGKGGVAKHGSDAEVFTSFEAILRSGEPLTASKRKRLKALSKASRSVCPSAKREYPSLPEPGAVPVRESLAAYAGPFEEAEVQRVCDRFLFGCSRAQKAEAKAIGLSAFVDRVTTAVPDPDFEAVKADLLCDGALAADLNNRCSDGGIQRTSSSSVGLTWHYRMMFGRNPFFERLEFFLHDERMAVSLERARMDRSCSAQSVLRHLEMLDRAALSGDYRQFMREWVSDQLGHLLWLDGAVNHKTEPNENFAREFWELGTVSPTALDGNANYTEYDIAQSALAFTGWTITDDRSNLFTPTDSFNRDGTNPRVPSCKTQFNRSDHALGPKVIFGGTPYEAVVYDGYDVLDATFHHPALAESLASDLWKEFISPDPSVEALKHLASEIRAADYHLIPVIRKIMTSRAFFDAANRQALVKHPVEMQIGLYRSLGLDSAELPSFFGESSAYFVPWSVSYPLATQDESPLSPRTVFGWNPLNLAGEKNLISWNSATSARMYNFWAEGEYGHGVTRSIADSLFDQPFGEVTADRVIDVICSTLGIDLSEHSRAVLREYLDSQLSQCYLGLSGCSEEDVAQGRRHLFTIPFAEVPEQIRRLRVLGAVAILASLPEYRLK